VIVELHVVPDCPNLLAARDLLRAGLAELGLPPWFTEVTGDYPSPSVLVDGIDVTGADTDGAARAAWICPPSTTSAPPSNGR
jgi:hypothetical protein